VEFPPTLRKLSRKKFTARESVSEHTTLGELLSILSAKYLPFKELAGYESRGENSEVLVLINGRFPPNDLKTKLSDGDEVKMFTVATGG
jgi:molybdopterin converting factor small subunit